MQFAKSLPRMQAFLVCFFTFSMVGCAQRSQSTSSDDLHTTITFSGYITEGSIDRFLEANRSKSLKKIILDSPGGEPIAAMRLGHWIFENSLAVQVEKTCMSSCANYLFVAGTQKTVSGNGIVGWHGGALQKNFVERDARFEDIERRLALGEEISTPELAQFKNAAAYTDYKYSQRSRLIQNDFFKKIKASEYLTRAGQEPRNLRAIWTFGKEELRKFGVCDVELPLNYSDSDYLKSVKENFGLSIISLKLNSQILATLEAEKSKLEYKLNLCN
jgi:hypothetical protein